IIIWDNGTASLGTVGGGPGNFTVSGSHTFGGFSNLHVVKVTIYDKGGSTTAVVDNVIDPPGPPDPVVAALPDDPLSFVRGKHNHRRHRHHAAAAAGHAKRSRHQVAE